MTIIELSANQRHVLEMAVNTSGYVEDYPTGLLGGARTSVVRALLRNGLVEPHDAGYRLTSAGWTAAGCEPPEAAALETGEACCDNGGNVSHAVSDEPTASTTTPTAASKQNRLELVVGLLSRPGGATIPQIMAATNWQAHSVRGFFAGTIRKKGYPLTSTKEGKEERVYRIQTEAAQADADCNAAE